jgi:hypothetical protein
MTNVVGLLVGLAIVIGGATGFTSTVIDSVKASAAKLAAYINPGASGSPVAEGMASVETAADSVKRAEARVNMRGVEDVTAAQMGVQQAIEQGKADADKLAKWGNSGKPVSWWGAAGEVAIHEAEFAGEHVVEHYTLHGAGGVIRDVVGGVAIARALAAMKRAPAVGPSKVSGAGKTVGSNAD